jgi:methionyl-tRNA synthetase
MMDYTHFLNAKPSIKLHIDIMGNHGIINLCSTYGCYEKWSNIELVEKEVARLTCSSCRKELPSSAQCEICGGPVVDFKLEKGGKVHVCSRIGCKHHFVTFEDIYETLTQFYNEYDYGAHDNDF